MDYTKTKYEGCSSFGRFNGRGSLELKDGTRYEGEFKNGQFDGEGTLIFPEGKIQGRWENGKQVEGQFTFSDGLQYTPANWTYCTGTDRRFFSEVTSSTGIAPAGELKLVDKDQKRIIPLGSYDPGNGIYTPSIDKVTDYDDMEDEGREPSPEERDWIIQKAPRG